MTSAEMERSIAALRYGMANIGRLQMLMISRFAEMESDEFGGEDDGSAMASESLAEMMEVADKISEALEALG